MNYIGLNLYDTANGEGIRVSLFVSGCRMHCKGCFNKQSWSFKAGKPFTNSEKEKIIKTLGQDYISGFSLLGGEPFEKEHEEVLTDLLSTIHRMYPQKSIWVWTGKLLDDVKESPLMKYVDKIIDGEFKEELANPSLQYKGSSNQNMYTINKTTKAPNLDYVKNFMAVMGVIQSGLYSLLELTEQTKGVANTPDNYSNYIAEEFKEFMAEKDNTPEQFKELCDLIWVCIQKANKQNYDLAKGMSALVDEYISKFYTKEGDFKPIFREDGKLMKNTGFKKANFTDLLNKETK